MNEPISVEHIFSTQVMILCLFICSPGGDGNEWVRHLTLDYFPWSFFWFARFLWRFEQASLSVDWEPSLTLLTTSYCVLRWNWLAMWLRAERAYQHTIPGIRIIIKAPLYTTLPVGPFLAWNNIRIIYCILGLPFLSWKVWSCDILYSVGVCVGVLQTSATNIYLYMFSMCHHQIDYSTRYVSTVLFTLLLVLLLSPPPLPLPLSPTQYIIVLLVVVTQLRGHGTGLVSGYIPRSNINSING